MQCVCGVTYPDTGVVWKPTVISSDQVGDDAFTRVEIYCGRCPECNELTIKIGEPKFIYETDFMSPEDQYEALGALEDRVRAAQRIFPTIGPPSRQGIDLSGVPEPVESDYRKALIALDHGVLYELASILARRSLEQSLSERYEGPNPGPSSRGANERRPERSVSGIIGEHR